MKTKILLLLVSMALFNLSTAFAESGMVRFTIDKALYQNMSDSQKVNIVQKIQELNNFVEGDLKSKIPSPILEKISGLKIKVEFTIKPGIDGLFIPNDQGGEQNISIQLSQLSTNGINSLLAHEIFHAIHFYINPDEYPWMREGMAQLFENITTGKFNGMNVEAARRNPFTPLLGEYTLENDDRAQYGHNLLYFAYLYNQCGGDILFWKLTEGNSQKDRGSYLIDSALSEMRSTREECADFAASAINFEVAKVFNRVQYLNQKEKNKYFISPIEMVPKFSIPRSEKELEGIVKMLPVLSSYALPLKDFISLKGKCSNCEVYYVQREFPNTVSQSVPDKIKGVDVVLVKTRSK